MRLSEKQTALMRRGGKFFVAVAVDRSLTSGMINCLMDVLLTSMRLSPRCASYFSTAASAALAGVMYLEAGPVEATARLACSFVGSWLGGKIFQWAKKGATFFYPRVAHDCTKQFSKASP
jgi:hypothetical protein